jgi:hypothetical protein
MKMFKSVEGNLSYAILDKSDDLEHTMLLE